MGEREEIRQDFTLMAESYKYVLISYVDVLGFSDFVNTSIEHPSTISEIQRILHLLRMQLAEGERFHIKYEIGKPPESRFRAYSFSDLTVRATIIDPLTELTDFLSREIGVLANKQLKLACWGADAVFPVILRGAISVGPISMNAIDKADELMFGPALVRAYKLENETAVFPRIVIDRELMGKLSSESIVNHSFIKNGDDGISFINYLFGCNEFYQADEPISFNNSPTTLANHKKMIEKSIMQLKSKGKPSDRVLQKYLWLANYHNWAVEQYKQLITPQTVHMGDELIDYEDEEAASQHTEALRIPVGLFNI